VERRSVKGELSLLRWILGGGVEVGRREWGNGGNWCGIRGLVTDWLQEVGPLGRGGRRTLGSPFGRVGASFFGAYGWFGAVGLPRRAQPDRPNHPARDAFRAVRGLALDRT
jgi:hypothetical protein